MENVLYNEIRTQMWLEIVSFVSGQGFIVRVPSCKNLIQKVLWSFFFQFKGM